MKHLAIAFLAIGTLAVFTVDAASAGNRYGR